MMEAITLIGVNFTVLHALGHGVLGGLLMLALQVYDKEFNTPDNIWNRVFVRVTIGGVTGYLWFLAGLPNSFNTVMAGALGPQIIEAVISQNKEIIEENVENMGTGPRSDFFKA